MRKVVKIRLYRIQDYDLYTLYYDPVFSLGDAMRLAIPAFAEGLPTPRIDVGYVRELPMQKPISIVMTVVLTSEKAIRMMEAASEHSRNANNLAKNLLRRSLIGIEKIYFEPKDAPLFAGRDILSDQPASAFNTAAVPAVKSGVGYTTKKEKKNRQEKKNEAAVPELPAHNDQPHEAELEEIPEIRGPIYGMDIEEPKKTPTENTPAVIPPEEEQKQEPAQENGGGLDMYDFISGLMDKM